MTGLDKLLESAAVAIVRRVDGYDQAALEAKQELAQEVLKVLNELDEDGKMKSAVVFTRIEELFRDIL